MKTKSRNLLYPIPIAEVNKEGLMERMSLFIGRKVEKIDLNTAAEYAGVVKALWEIRDIETPTINGREIHPASLAAYVDKLSESLSFAFRQAHGIQRFDIEEFNKKNLLVKRAAFSVTDVEFYEEAVILFGTTKDENKKEEEYLVYWFLDNFEFYSSNVNQRKPNNRVFLNFTDKTGSRLSTIARYAYKYLKLTDEVMLSKLTELLTGEQVSKPNREMFIVLNRALQQANDGEERKNLIADVLRKAFHRFVQTSREKHGGLIAQDLEGAFQMGMENIAPCAEKKGFRFQGLREYEETPWKNYRLNLEYDYKKNEILIYDKEWLSQIGELTWDETPNNLKEIKNWRRCVNVYFNASKTK